MNNTDIRLYTVEDVMNRIRVLRTEIEKQPTNPLPVDECFRIADKVDASLAFNIYWYILPALDPTNPSRGNLGEKLFSEADNALSRRRDGKEGPDLIHLETVLESVAKFIGLSSNDRRAALLNRAWPYLDVLAEKGWNIFSITCVFKKIIPDTSEFQDARNKLEKFLKIANAQSAMTTIGLHFDTMVKAGYTGYSYLQVINGVDTIGVVNPFQAAKICWRAILAFQNGNRDNLESLRNSMQKYSGQLTKPDEIVDFSLSIVTSTQRGVLVHEKAIGKLRPHVSRIPATKLNDYLRFRLGIRHG